MAGFTRRGLLTAGDRFAGATRTVAFCWTALGAGVCFQRCDCLGHRQRDDKKCQAVNFQCQPDLLVLAGWRRGVQSVCHRPVRPDRAGLHLGGHGTGFGASQGGLIVVDGGSVKNRKSVSRLTKNCL